MTAYGRLKLYDLMKRVPAGQLCYVDTDSLQFILEAGQENPFLAEMTGNLGDLTDEVRKE